MQKRNNDEPPSIYKLYESDESSVVYEIYEIFIKFKTIIVIKAKNEISVT